MLHVPWFLKLQMTRQEVKLHTIYSVISKDSEKKTFTTFWLFLVRQHSCKDMAGQLGFCSLWRHNHRMSRFSTKRATVAVGHIRLRSTATSVRVTQLESQIGHAPVWADWPRALRAYSKCPKTEKLGCLCQFCNWQVSQEKTIIENTAILKQTCESMGHRLQLKCFLFTFFTQCSSSRS